MCSAEVTGLLGSWINSASRPTIVDGIVDGNTMSSKLRRPAVSHVKAAGDPIGAACDIQ